MNLQQFNLMAQNIKQSVELVELYQASEGMDNNFRDLNSPKAGYLENSYQGIFETSHLDGHYFGDFTWDSGNKICTYTAQGTLGSDGAGHPGLTTNGTTACAGVIGKEGGIIFHSGHFQPKANNVLHFMVNFINNSLERYRKEQMGLTEEDDMFIERMPFQSEEALLTYLCEKFPIEVYYDDSKTATITTTFVDLYQHVQEFNHFKTDDISKKQQQIAKEEAQLKQQQKRALVTDLLDAGRTNLNTYFFGKKGGTMVEFEGKQYRVPSKIANSVNHTTVKEQYKNSEITYPMFKQSLKTTLAQQVGTSTNKGRSPKTVAFYSATKSQDDLETSIATYR
ncbi:hypothetical protein L3V82_12460 [Thiotrichales bacterium 19S3-7]|nr:hypothetical protein [Thiotrichales bacterium 19S3-7]MCF6803003.1 hypothetical protein [Thiotrichales bacterium 19S3-11]